MRAAVAPAMLDLLYPNDKGCGMINPAGLLYPTPHPIWDFPPALEPVGYD